MGFLGGERSNNVGDSLDFEVSQQVALLPLYRSSLRLSDHPTPTPAHMHKDRHTHTLFLSAMGSPHSCPLLALISCMWTSIVLYCLTFVYIRLLDHKCWTDSNMSVKF